MQEENVYGKSARKNFFVTILFYERKNSKEKEGSEPRTRNYRYTRDGLGVCVQAL